MLGIDWFGFIVSFSGAFILGALFGGTITAMMLERRETDACTKDNESNEE